MKDVAWKLVPALVNFQRLLFKKESEEICKQIWINFGSFAITYLISHNLLQKFLFSKEVVPDSY